MASLVVRGPFRGVSVASGAVAAESYEIAGKVVLVTGAARGLGLEAARRLHALGASVALVGLEPSELERRAAELGERAWWYEADVTSMEAMEAAVAGTVERFGGLDVVIANAGVAPNGTVASVDPAAFDRTIEVNLLGVFRTVRAALPHVIARRGYVLIISSASALVHTPLMAAYTASKAGVEAFGDALRLEVAHTGTKVGVAYFGFIDTEMVHKIIDADPLADSIMDQMPKPLLKRLPPAVAGEAIVKGIERRSPRIIRPRRWTAMSVLRGILNPINDRRSERDPEFQRIVEQLDARGNEEQPTSA